MYQAILKTHIIVVTIFLVLYLVKTILLLANKNEGLQKFTKITKVPEMVISFLFLGTGIYLFIQSGSRDTLLYIKLICVFASIPLAIVGFKKQKKALAALSLLLLILAYGLAEMHGKRVKMAATTDDTNVGRPMSGDQLYMQNCVACHGEKGDAGLSGASDLSASQLDKEGKVLVIKNGKGGMPAYSGKMSEEEIHSLADYIETLKK